MTPPSRLRWRCRRGTRELDVMLGWWLDARFTAADSSMQTDFDALLDCSDPDLWDWLTGHAIPDEPRFAVIINEIRAHHHL